MAYSPGQSLVAPAQFIGSNRTSAKGQSQPRRGRETSHHGGGRSQRGHVLAKRRLGVWRHSADQGVVIASPRQVEAGAQFTPLIRAPIRGAERKGQRFK